MPKPIWRRERWRKSRPCVPASDWSSSAGGTTGGSGSTGTGSTGTGSTGSTGSTGRTGSTGGPTYNGSFPTYPTPPKDPKDLAGQNKFQEDMFAFQQASQNMNMFWQMMQNTLKSMGDTANNAVRNLR